MTFMPIFAVPAQRVAKRLSRAPIPFIDDQGTRCLRVPLDDQHRHYATVEEDDYAAIVTGLGLDALWYLSPNRSQAAFPRYYVAVNVPRAARQTTSLIMVARLIVDVGARQRVRYVSPDKLDLRRMNLRVEGGAGAALHGAREAVADAVRRSRAAKA